MNDIVVAVKAATVGDTKGFFDFTGEELVSIDFVLCKVSSEEHRRDHRKAVHVGGLMMAFSA